MSTLFFRHARVFALVIGVIIALGATALLTIGRQEDPTITNLFATIVTPYPGASPDRVEALVTEKIEEELREIAEIEEITSVSRTGISVVSVELSSFISETEIEQSWSEIRDALSDAARRFPAGVPEPEFDDDRTSAYTAISAVMPRAGVPDNPALLRRYAELLQDRLRAVPGTKVVELFGEQQEEILVEIDPVQLASLGLSVDQVSQAIAQADAKVQAGQLRGNAKDMLIEVAGEFETLSRIREIPIVTGEQGPLLRVSDVAEVYRGIEEPARIKALADGVPAVVVAARMEPDLQVDTWMTSAKKVMSTFEAELPAGLEHRLLFDQSDYTADRLSEVAGNMAIGVSLVVAVLLITMGWRAALVVAVMLPLTSLLSLAVLQKLGVPIHQMSVTGLIVALGLLVDAAIVMTDEIRQRLERGMAVLDAVGAAVRRLAVPLLASTATTVLAFVPMALLPGPAGDFVGSIATAVIVMLISSFLLAITIAPALAGFLLPGGLSPGSHALWRNGISAGLLGRLFAASLRLSLRYRVLAVMAALVLPVMGFGAFPTLTAQFFPGVERDQFYVQVKLPVGASISETEATARAADAILKDEAGIVQTDWFMGESAPSFYYNMTMNQDGVASFAEALVTTASEEATVEVIPRLQGALDRALPQAQIIIRDLVQGPPVAAPVELRLVGPDLEVLKRLGEELRQRVAATPGVTHTKADLLGGPPKLLFELDEDKVRLAGLDLATVARQMESLLEGATGGSLIEATEELPVRVRVAGSARGNSDAIAAIDIMPPDAAAVAAQGGYPGVPLAALGQLTLVPSDSSIARRNGERVNTVQAYLQLGLLPEEVLKAIQTDLGETPLALPAGYRLEIGGDADARAETVRNLMSSMGLVVVLLVSAIVLTFNSFRLSLIAGLVSLLSMGLSLLALAVFGYPFGIQALIGVIGSIGVSINAAIIIMTGLQADPGARIGDPERIVAIVMGTSRHIVSTTITTFGGFLPLILGGGGFWPPFAMAIAGGVLLSTVVSFYFVPPMYSLAVRKRGAAKTDDSGDTITPLGAPAARAAE